MKHIYFFFVLLFPLFTFCQIIIVNSPNDLTVECDGNGNTSDLNAWLTSNGGAIATPECGVITWSNNFTGLTNDCGSAGSTIVNFTASDDCGLATTTATFSIQDTTPPTSITSPSNTTVICDGFGNISEYNAWLNSLNNVDFEDSCSVATVSVSETSLPGDCNGTSGYTRTFTATDDCGNTVTEIARFNILPATSDCPQGNINLNGQAEVDNFGSTYPDCDTIEGYLIITGNDVVDLTPLSQINSVGSLQIENTSLQSMAGLGSLTIDSFSTENSFIVISNNPLLQDIQFLSTYTVNFPVVFIVRDMPLLTSLDGAGSINEFVTIYIENNDVLTNLNGLNENLNLVFEIQPPTLYISENAILSDISRLDTVQSDATLNVIVTDNLQLAVCENNLICNAVANSAATLQDNAIGCNSTIQVAQACGIIPSNDDCEGAIEITFGSSTESYNDFATASSQIPSCNDENRVDVWFKFNSLNIPAISILTTSGYNMQLWEGTCDALTQVDNACATGILQDILVSANTEYHIQVWSNGTGRIATGVFDILIQDAALSVNENIFENFSIFPNPVINILNLKSSQNIDELQVYNLLGQNVMSIKPNASQTQLDMSGLDSGLYILKVMIGNEMASYKIIKE